jgi:hypothetical protein
LGESRTLYRSDDLTALLPLRTAQPLALPGETYKLALTPAMINRIFGARVTPAILTEGAFVQLPGDSNWWIPSGRSFLSAGDADTPAQELAAAKAHYFGVRRAVDPFGGISRVAYDPYDILPLTTVDAAGNTTQALNDYRVLSPVQITDHNGNASGVAIDVRGKVTGTAVTGKAGEGDSLTGFNADLTDAEIAGIRANPLNDPDALLGKATSRVVYDLFAYFRTRALPNPDAPMVYTLTRETHVADLAGGTTKFHHAFTYSDGFAREAQRKIQAEPGAVPGIAGTVNPRWAGSGWTVFNNKGKAVRSYEPFFTGTHLFEFNRLAGVSSVAFYDPLERLIATLYPDNTFEKAVFDAWRQEVWDRNDTVKIADPRTDENVGDFFLRLVGNAPGAFVSWRDKRIGGTFGATPEEQAANQDAAQKASLHAATPSVMHFDSLGRTALSVADNGAQRFPTRTAMDAANKPLAVFDALGHRVAEYFLREPGAGGTIHYVAGYDMAGNGAYAGGMDGGEQRTLSDIAGKPIRSWNARGFAFRMLFDVLRRPTHRFVSNQGAPETLLERSVYGDRQPGAALNLKRKISTH